MTLEKRERLLWIDTETTGLDPARHVLIEVAVVVTEIDDLKPLEGAEWVIAQSAAVLQQASVAARELHARSGLLERSLQSVVAMDETESRLLAIASRWCAPRQAILAGNSIWQDRRFLTAYAPRFESYLHYRQVDVSTLKILFASWFGRNVVPKKAEAHTAREDVLESIAELTHYRDLVAHSRR